MIPSTAAQYEPLNHAMITTKDDRFRSQQPPPTAASRTVAIGSVALTIVLWGLAVALPVWETRSNGTGEWATGNGVFPALLGWLGILAACPAWFANLFLIPLCIMVFKSPKAAFWLSLAAIVIALTAYCLPGLYGDNDEAVIVRRLIGYYLWIGSFVMISAACAWLGFTTQRNRILASASVVTLTVVAILMLEKAYPVGVSPLEAALKNPKDLTALTAALAHHPPHAEKDAALKWAIRMDLAQAVAAPSKPVAMLIDAGANPNQPDKSGDTLLMQALSVADRQASCSCW